MKLNPITVTSVAQAVKFLPGAVFTASFAPVPGKRYFAPNSGVSAKSQKLEVAHTSYWYELCKLGLARPYKIVATWNGREFDGAGINNEMHILQKASLMVASKDGVLVGDGKQVKGYIVYPNKNPILLNMIMDGKLLKESTRFNGNHRGITSFNEDLRIKAIDWTKVMEGTYLGTIGDGPAITPHKVEGIGEGSAYQWRITDVIRKDEIADATDKGSLTVVPWDVWEHACNKLGIATDKVHIIASTECFKFPGREHLEVVTIKPEALRFVGVRNSERQNKAALTLVGTATCPMIWPIINRLVDFHSDAHRSATMIAMASIGDHKAINDLFKAQLDVVSKESMTITSMLFNIPDGKGGVKHPFIRSTVNGITRRARKAFLQKVRKVPMLDGGSRMVTWAPIIEDYVQPGTGVFPIKFVDQAMLIAWDAVAKTYGDADGDDMCFIEIAHGVYLIWRNPVNGVNAFSVCIDIDSKATIDDIPSWVLPVVEANKEFHYIPEPPKGKKAKPINFTEAVAHHQQDLFNAYFGGAKLGASTQDVYKYSFMSWMQNKPFSVHESCMWAGKLEMEIVKGIKSNNRTMIKMTDSPTDIFFALKNDRDAFLPAVAPTTDAEVAIWALFTKDSGTPYGTLRCLSDAAYKLNGAYDDMPLVNVTKPLAIAADNIITELEADRITMAKICQFIRSKALDLFDADELDTNVSLALMKSIRQFYNGFMNQCDAEIFNYNDILNQVSTSMDPIYTERLAHIAEIMESCGLKDNGNYPGSQVMTQHMVNMFYQSRGMHGQELHDHKLNTFKDMKFINAPKGIACTTGLMTIWDEDARRFAIQCMNLAMRTTLAEGKYKGVPYSKETMVHAAMRIGAEVFQNEESKGQGMFYMCFSMDNIHRALNIWNLGLEAYTNAPVDNETDEALVSLALDEDYVPFFPEADDDEDYDYLANCG